MNRESLAAAGNENIVKEDWQDREFVDWYNKHLRFEKEQLDAYLALLDLGSEDSFVDFGCGNGSLLEKVAPLVKNAVGLDGSEEQLRQAREKLHGSANVELINAGFLDCDLSGWVFTRASARKALHHLPDAEKKIFFRRISEHFAAGALFVLEDGIYDFDIERLAEHKDSILVEAKAYYGPRWDMIKDAFIKTITEEFPTDKANWLSAFSQGGFELVTYQRVTSFYGKILTRKV